MNPTNAEESTAAMALSSNKTHEKRNDNEKKSRLPSSSSSVSIFVDADAKAIGNVEKTQLQEPPVFKNPRVLADASNKYETADQNAQPTFKKKQHQKKKKSKINKTFETNTENKNKNKNKNNKKNKKNGLHRNENPNPVSASNPNKNIFFNHQHFNQHQYHHRHNYHSNRYQTNKEYFAQCELAMADSNQMSFQPSFAGWTEDSLGSFVGSQPNYFAPQQRRHLSATIANAKDLFEPGSYSNDGDGSFHANSSNNNSNKNSNNNNNSNSNQNAENSSTTAVSLQDAWSKPLELPSASTAATATMAPAVEAAASEHGQKRPRTNSYRPYCRSRVLFRSERRPPQQLLAAIRRKGARLEMVNSGDAGAVHLVLEFETAFTMTIFFSPLSVSLRAKPPPAGGNNNNNNNNEDNDNDNDNDTARKSGDRDGSDDDDNDNDEQTTTTTTVSWKPLSHGLTPWGSNLDSGDFRRKRKDREDRELGVWGVTGTYESIGRVVEERLRDASTHATHVLRKCFRNHVKDNMGVMEVQLLEGSALLEFLQVARSTYMPHWEDRDF